MMIAWGLGTDIYSATASEKKMGKEGEEGEEEEEKEKDHIAMLWEAVVDLQKRVRKLERKLEDRERR